MITAAGSAIAVLEAVKLCGTKRKLKEELLRKNKDNAFLKNYFLWTYDWMRTYGVTPDTIIRQKQLKRPGDFHAGYQQLETLLYALSQRKMTGTDARTWVGEHLSGIDPRQATWHELVLGRDLDIGIGSATINKIWPGFLPQFTCMKAKIWGDEEVVYPVFVEPKIDGMRVLTVLGPSGACAYSRKGHAIPSLQWLADDLSRRGINDTVFDGEYWGENWNETVSLLRREDHTPTQLKKLKELSYYVFDCLSLKEFKAGGSGVMLEDRRKRLDFLKKCDVRPIKIVTGKVCHNVAAVIHEYRVALSKGFEGVMVKPISGKYEDGRHSYWLKIKPEKTLDSKIVGFEEGAGRNAGRLGAFVLRLPGGDETKCGTGFSDELREKFWQGRSKLLGRVCEVKMQDDGKSKVAVARFPVFVRIRDDL